MARRKKGEKIKGRFIPLTHNMIESEAWRSLSGNAIKVYIMLLRKRNGANDRDLSLTYRELQGYLSVATFRKCMIALVEAGFIDLVRKGGLQKQCNIFGISERWKDYGTEGFEKRTLQKSNYYGFGEIWKARRAKAEQKR